MDVIGKKLSSILEQDLGLKLGVMHRNFLIELRKNSVPMSMYIFNKKQKLFSKERGYQSLTTSKISLKILWTIKIQITMNPLTNLCYTHRKRPT